MAEKYYIGDDIQFIRGLGELSPSVQAAAHYKRDEARNFINKRQGFVALQIFSSSKNRHYAIMTEPRFLGNDNNIVNTMESAKQFLNIDDANNYINEHSDLFELFDNPFIYSSKYRKTKIKKLSLSAQQKPLLIKEDNESTTNSPEISKKSKRICFTKSKKMRVKESSDVCYICGKPINDCEATIDHVVPLALGGSNGYENLRPVHEHCNKAKFDLPLDDFYRYVGDVTAYHFADNYDHDMMLHLARAIVRGTLKNSFGGSR